MLGRTYDTQDCSIARSLEVIGERWTLLILRDLTFGLHGFDEIRTSLDVATNVLADRLGKLCDEGLVERARVQGDARRVAYGLTPKGLALQPVLFHLAKWGDRFYASPLGPPRLALHRGCDGEVDERVTCGRCGAQVAFEDIHTVPRGAADPR